MFLIIVIGAAIAVAVLSYISLRECLLSVEKSLGEDLCGELSLFH